MREIKFRGLRTDGSGWIYGSLSVEYDGSCFISYWYSKLIEPENNYHEMTCEWFEVIPETVGQFTGLKDENGIEIYEGDILLMQTYKMTVKFHNGCFYAVNEINNIHVTFANSVVEVTGNIHEIK